ncbi:MAG: thymidine phosphorylase, partial [Nitrospirae bacterium CG01_land_8_20_14_3_00_44_22]
MRAYDIIKKKRDGAELSREELSFLISAYLSNKIPDYQMSSFLMAVYFRGMTDAETIALTELMLASGSRLDFSDISTPKVDKHSTGGVGDKTSIILAPLIAAMNVKVPMIAGRGLGHTGGTIDKLESIPGLRTDLSIKEFKDNVKGLGFSIISQTDEIAPADKKLYSLRDVTATV